MDSELRNYVQDMYNYSALATAVAVVLSKPEGQTVEDYLCTLRDRLTAKEATVLSNTQVQTVEDNVCTPRDGRAVTEAGANKDCTPLCAARDNSQEIATDSGYGSQDASYFSPQQESQQNLTFPGQDAAVPELHQGPQTADSVPDLSKVPSSSKQAYNNSFETDLIGDVLKSLDDKSPSGTDSVDECAVERYDNHQNDRETAVENARFIYALVGLRFAARKEAFVPASTVSHYLSMVSSDVAKNFSASLLGSSEADVVADNNIASALIQYHTRQAHEHLLQSVNGAVAAIGSLVLDKRPHLVRECFYNWENSTEHYVIDNISSALDFLCDEEGDSVEYTSSCLELVKSFFESVMEAENNEFVMWEQQCGMLLKLVGHRHVCGRVLSLLVENIKQLADSVSQGARLTTSECAKKMHTLSSMQERSFYMFNLAEDLLLEYKKIHGDVMKKYRETESIQEIKQDSGTVDTLWKNAYSFEDHDNSEMRSSQHLISAWKDSLAQSAMTFTNHNAHLLSIYAWSCVDLVKELQQ